MSSNTKALDLLGMARRSGRMAYGIETVTANARSILLILVAADIGSATERKARRVAETTNIQVVKMPYTKDRTGKALGLESCSVVGITDKGFATNIRHQIENEVNSVFSPAKP